jgi:glycosyltransferase involved in cell wall biosynthesis
MGFSVLISVYDKENPVFLNKALQSIWDTQSLRPSEIVLVKDGHLNDGLEQIVQIWKSKLKEILVLIQIDKNVGLGGALNIGLASCRHDFIARMDSDDIALPTRLELQYKFLKTNPHISVVGTFIEEFVSLPGDSKAKRILPVDPELLVSFSVMRNPLNHMTVMFRKTDVMSVGSYENQPFFEDYHLWLKLSNSGFKIANLDKVLLFVRTGNDMIGRRHGVQYVKHEFSFFYRVYKDGYLTFTQMIVNLCLRTPLRLIPKSLLKIVYRYNLRAQK